MARGTDHKVDLVSDIQLLQGDCLELMNDIPDHSVNMICSDLPYGTTQCKWDSVLDMNKLWEQYWRIIKDNGAIVLTATPPFSAALASSSIKEFRYSWYWKKPHTGQLNAKRMPLKNVEEILVFYRKQPIYNPQFSVGTPYEVDRKGYKGSECYGKQRDHSTVNSGFRYPTQILEYKHDTNRVHPTQKPVALLEYLINTYTLGGGTVMDNCMGSGSTGVACVNTGRNFIGMELDPEYFKIAEERIKKAEREVNLNDE